MAQRSRSRSLKHFTWSPLKSGDIVDVVAPASGCDPRHLQAGLKMIESWGFVPRVPKDILNPPNSMFSNTDTKRLDHLKSAFSAKDSSIVWCLRGGYGSIRLLPGLEKMGTPERVKCLIGYSDITSLHSFVNNKWGWPSLHGPLVERLGSGRHPKADLNQLHKIITGRQRDVEFGRIRPINQKAMKMKSHLSTSIAGGNLCVLTSSLGTPWESKFKGRTLFLEEIGEKPHRFDRFLVQLSQSGALSGCHGIIFGNILNEQKSQTKLIWNQVVAEFSRALKIPVFAGLPVGHGTRQKALPLGTKTSLRSSSGGLFKLVVSTGVDD